VTFAASFLTGALVLGPIAKKPAVVGPTTPQGQELIGRLFTISRVDLIFMYAIVCAMTVKPTSDDGWVVLGAAAVLVVLSVLFLSSLRTDAPTEAAATD
jgi:hypothetical protein